MDFSRKKAIVCGIARSGIASALLLKKLGAVVYAQDIKGQAELKGAELKLEEAGVNLILQKNPDEELAEMDLMILSPGIPTDLPFIKKARELGVPVWSEIELAYRVCPCPIAAITGTNGKTTTTALTGEVMADQFGKAAVVGNIGIPFTEKVSQLAAADFVVAELSSFQLETVHNFKPHICAVLNITPDHLNRHKTLANYIAVKERIFENQTGTDFTILNYDDDTCRDMAKRTRGRVVFFSRLSRLSEGVFLDRQEIVANIDGISQQETIININSLKIFGGHNIENALAATAIALCAGAQAKTISRALAAFEGVEHRIEFVRELNGVSFYNDSKATNPDSAIKSVEAMNRPIILIGGGSYKGSDYSGWVKTFNGRVKNFIAIGEVADEIINTCRAYDFKNCEKANSLKDAVELAQARASRGDCVLLSPACASYDMFDDYEQRGRKFKEFVNCLED